MANVVTSVIIETIVPDIIIAPRPSHARPNSVNVNMAAAQIAAGLREMGVRTSFSADSLAVTPLMQTVFGRLMDKLAKRVMIIGGGNIGRRLARALEGDYQVKLIEYNKKSCEQLAGELSHTLVLNGDGMRRGCAN